MAIAEFANALLVIPKTLALNAAKDASDLVAKLRTYHAAAQIAKPDDEKRKYKNYGLDLINGKIVNEATNGIGTNSIQNQILKSAFEACVSILRIDTIIEVHPEPPKEDPHAH